LLAHGQRAPTDDNITTDDSLVSNWFVDDVAVVQFVACIMSKTGIVADWDVSDKEPSAAVEPLLDDDAPPSEDQVPSDVPEPAPPSDWEELRKR